VLNIPILLDRLCYRQPSFLVDAITEHEAGRRLVAVKNVTVNEEFFQGHFPGAPVLPGVMMLESLSQVAAMLLLHREDAPPNARVYLRGINDAKFRRQVFPGDQLTVRWADRSATRGYAFDVVNRKQRTVMRGGHLSW